MDRLDPAAQLGAGAQRGEEIEEVGGHERRGGRLGELERSSCARRRQARRVVLMHSRMSYSPALFLTIERESLAHLLFVWNNRGHGVRGTVRSPADARPAARRPAAPPAPRGRHAHHRRGHRRGPVVRRCVRRPDGRQHRERRADGARRLPPGGRARAHRRRRYAAVPGARGRLCTGPRRGAQRSERRRAAVGVPRGCTGGLARAVRHRGQRRHPREHAGVVRGAGLRLHRRAVRRLGRRARRRAGHQWASAPALSRPARRRAAAGRPGRCPGVCGRARRLGAAQDA